MMSEQNNTTTELLDALRQRPDLPLTFRYQDVMVNQGYHVVEVKFATVQSLDCGKGSDQWNELTVQLLDGSATSTAGYMQTGKFVGILGAAFASLPDDASKTVDQLFFEFAPGNGPLYKLHVASVDINEDAITIALGSESAVCKPLLRFMKGLPGVGRAIGAGKATGDCCSGTLNSSGEAEHGKSDACCSSSSAITATIASSVSKCCSGGKKSKGSDCCE